jgi:predicted metal-dependent phosphoesterase TrpH
MNEGVDRRQRRYRTLVIDWYRRHGYHFLAFTDHGVLSETQTVADDFVLLSGIETDGVDPHMGVYHLVGLGLDEPPAMDLVGANMPIQEAIDRLRAAGGLVSLPHPYWLGQMSKDLIALKGCFGIEIYNGGSESDIENPHPGEGCCLFYGQFSRLRWALGKTIWRC